MYRAPVAGLKAADSWTNLPAELIGWVLAGAWTRDSNRNPGGCVDATFAAPVKSGPMSGPFTVSSHVIQAPQGMHPPAQFIWVPARLAYALYPPPFAETSMV